MLFRLNKNVVLLFILAAFAISSLLIFNKRSPRSVANMELFINEKRHLMQNRRRHTENSTNRLAIFLVVEKADDLHTEYQLAHLTLQCYCAMKNYPLVVVDLSQNNQMRTICPQKDFMFRRHCALAHWLSGHRHIEWTLFLDADMAVINPNHLVEDYLPENGIDLVFYERLFNGEIAAGSYLARNTEFTRRFLLFWANYYAKLPWSWHGTDNGAIHAVFLDYFCGEHCSTRRAFCWKLWRASEHDDGLRMFTDCARSVLGKRNVFRDANGTVRLNTDFRKNWARDGWLSGSKWCSRDFLIHGWKKKWQNSENWGGWKSPLSMEENRLKQHLNSEKCAAVNEGSAAPNWPYNPEFVTSEADIDRRLQARLHETRMTQLDYWRRVEEFAEGEGQL